MRMEGFEPAAVELTPKQKELAEHAQLFINRVKIGLEGVQEEIVGSVVIKSAKYTLHMEEYTSKPNDEPRYSVTILGDKSTEGTSNHWKELKGESAKKLFDFYKPLAKKERGFDDPSNQVVETIPEEQSIEDMLLGGE